MKNSLTSLIGNTPFLLLERLFDQNHCSIWLKMELLNPGGSIKDRIALAMIEDAEKKGLIKPGGTIIEATSGNTGIAIAMIAAKKGYSCVIVMPENMSVERRLLIKLYGGKIILTDAAARMTGAIEKAQFLHQNTANSWIPKQFENQANVEIHMKTTAIEILEKFPNGIDILICGVGTGGHLTGVGKILKQHFPSIQVIAVEPASSAVLSGKAPGKHNIQGIGAGFVPPLLELSLIDHIIQVEDNQAIWMCKLLAEKEGIMAGISTGAVLYAAKQYVSNTKKPITLLTFAYDRGERYLTMFQ